MNNLITGFLSSPWALRIGWMLVHSLWQGTIVAFLLGLTLRLLRDRSSQSRWLAACIALAAMAILPVLTAFLVPVQQHAMDPASSRSNVATVTQVAASRVPPEDMTAGGDSVERPPVRVSGPIPDSPAGVMPLGHPASVADANECPFSFGRISDRLRPMMPWLLLGWLAGVSVMSFWHLGGWILLQWTRRCHTCPVSPGVCRIFRRLLQRLRISRSVQLLESVSVAVPVVIGWLRPVILLPASAIYGITPAQLEAVLAHELAHIRRFDYLVGLIQAVIETLFFYHPAVWWVSRRIRQESEYCCDELALRACPDRQNYAHALLRIVELGAQQPHLAPAASGGKVLPRIRRILGLPVSQSGWSARWLAGILVLAGLLAAGGIMYQASAVKAQDRPTTRPSAKAADRATQLMANLKSFSLSLTYHGNQDKPYYGLRLSVEQLASDNPFEPAVTITPQQAEKIIAYLAIEGYLDQALDLNRDRSPSPPPKPYYSLIVQVNKGAVGFEEWLAWDLKMLHRLDGLRQVLDGDAARNMDLLLGRLSGQRREWEKKDAAVQLVEAAPAAAPGPIERLAERLSSDQLWQNGLAPMITLPQTASTEEVVSKVFDMTSFGQAKTGKENRILEVKQVRIPGSLPDQYTAAVVETNLGQKIVLINYAGGRVGWWSRVYDSEPTTQPWGESRDGLRARLSAEATTFRAGLPIQVKLELQNAGKDAKPYGSSTAPWNDALIVLDERGRKMPYVGGLASVAVAQMSIDPGQVKELASFDLAESYYLRRPGKYSVKWSGERGFPAGPGHGDIPGTPALPALPASAELRFEVVGEPAAQTDGDPVGRLLPLRKDQWRLTVATKGKVYPGSNWQEVSGCCMTFDYYPTNDQKESSLVWLCLADEPAVAQPSVAVWPPPSEYLGKVSRWHVYLHTNANALKTWPEAKEDIKRALAAGERAPTPLTRPVVAQPVKENGLEFQTVAQAEWPIPAPGGKTEIQLGLKVTYPVLKSAKQVPQQINLFDTVRLVLEDSAGRSLPWSYGRDRSTIPDPLIIAPGQTKTIARNATLQWMSTGEGLRLLGRDEAGSLWWFDGLKPGKYTLAFELENTPESTQIAVNRPFRMNFVDPKDAPFWMGKVATREAAVELAAIAAGPTAPPATRPAQMQAHVDLLLKQLGAEKWEDRQAAQDELVKLGEDVIPDLRKLRGTTTDEEVRTRVEAMLATPGGLSTRLSIKTTSFKAGEAIPINLEVGNASNEAKAFQRPTDPWNSTLIVRDDHGRDVPYLGGAVQALVPRITIGAHENVALESFDLARWYYLRRPGKYTVSWPGSRFLPRGRVNGIPIVALPATPQVQFEVAANPTADADGDPVGRLLPLVKQGWEFEAAQTAPGKLRPGGNRQEVIGRSFAFTFPSAGWKGPMIWLWLADQPAAEQPATGDWPPPSEYVGKVSRWHVYI
ncbi:MAG: M56 family metallopeptidase, partial [Tepidisphaerales bacterium]